MKNKTQLIPEMQQIFNQTIAWTKAQSESNLNYRHFEGKWTAAQHIYHLVKSTKGLSQAMKLPKANLRKMFGDLERDQFSYDKIVEQYSQLLATSPKAGDQFSANINRMFLKEEILSRIEKEFEDMIAVTAEWTEEDLSNFVVPHPILGKFSVREMLYFTIFHTTHHYKALKTKYEQKID